MNFRLSGACLVLSSLTVSVTPASAQSFNQFIGFGDSNIDSGYFLTHPIRHQALYSQSAAVGAIGFSRKTCLPARRASIAICR